MSRRSAVGLAGLLSALALGAGVGALAITHRPAGAPAPATSAQAAPVVQHVYVDAEDD